MSKWKSSEFSWNGIAAARRPCRRGSRSGTRRAAAEHAVLDRGEHLVADPLVEGHAAAKRVEAVDHPRRDEGVGLLLAERAHDLGQVLRRVLAVAVEQHDVVEALPDRVEVAELLVAAVPAVERRAEYRTLEPRRPPAACAARTSVARGVVDHVDLGEEIAQLGGDPVENALDESLRLEGDDEDRHLRARQDLPGGGDCVLVDDEAWTRGRDSRARRRVATVIHPRRVLMDRVLAWPPYRSGTRDGGRGRTARARRGQPCFGMRRAEASVAIGAKQAASTAITRYTSSIGPCRRSALKPREGRAGRGAKRAGQPSPPPAGSAPHRSRMNGCRSRQAPGSIRRAGIRARYHRW